MPSPFPNVAWDVASWGAWRVEGRCGRMRALVARTLTNTLALGLTLTLPHPHPHPHPHLHPHLTRSRRVLRSARGRRWSAHHGGDDGRGLETLRGELTLKLWRGDELLLRRTATKPRSRPEPEPQLEP